jgi:hypothetical protein
MADQATGRSPCLWAFLKSVPGFRFPKFAPRFYSARDEYWEDEFEATQPLNGLFEQGLPVPLDFFDFWREHISSYRGDRGSILETEFFGNVVELTEKHLAKIANR